MRAWISAHWFPLGVAALTAAATGFLLHQLLAWPPHEDEALPLFIGRRPLDEVFQVGARGARRRAVALPARLGRRSSRSGPRGPAGGVGGVRCRSLPVIALLLARLGGRLRALIATAIVAASWTSSSTASTDGCTASSCSRARSRISRCSVRSSAAGGRHGRSGRWRFWRRSRRIRTGRSCSRRRVLSSSSRGATGCARRSGRSARWQCSDPVLAHRSRARRPLRRRRRRWRPAGRPPLRLAGDRRLHRRLPRPTGRSGGGAAGLAALPRETRVMIACAALVRSQRLRSRAAPGRPRRGT